jgi:hypothetical protein
MTQPYQCGQSDYKAGKVERHEDFFASREDYWQYVDGYRNGHEVEATNHVRINEMLEVLFCEDGSIDLFNLSGRILSLSEDDAYKLLSFLQSHFPNLPIIEHLNLG